jgi:hypothetical protein
MHPKDVATMLSIKWHRKTQHNFLKFVSIQGFAEDLAHWPLINVELLMKQLCIQTLLPADKADDI